MKKTSLKNNIRTIENYKMNYLIKTKKNNDNLFHNIISLLSLNLHILGIHE